MDYSYGICDIPFTAQAKAIYYAVYDDQKISLITCSFTVGGCCTAYLEDEDTNEIEEMEGCVDLPEIAGKYSSFAEVEDVEGLRELDFHASGVPVCEDELKKKHFEDYIGENDDSEEFVDYNELGDYTIEEMKSDLESALATAFSDAFIDFEDGEYQCSRSFSRNKISGKFF